MIPYGGYANTFPDVEHFFERAPLLLTARGYAVVRPNTRGVASGPQETGYGEWQLEDTIRLLDELGRTQLVDTTRVGVIGHSHGATMAYSYVTHSDRFNAAIGVNGAADWAFQAGLNSMTGLPGAMDGTPEAVPDAYRAASPAANAASAAAPLMIVAGAGDTQIAVRNATVFADSLQPPSTSKADRLRHDRFQDHSPQCRSLNEPDGICPYPRAKTTRATKASANP